MATANKIDTFYADKDNCKVVIATMIAVPVTLGAKKLFDKVRAHMISNLQE